MFGLVIIKKRKYEELISKAAGLAIEVLELKKELRKYKRNRGANGKFTK